MPLISLCMIVRNEEAVLGRCLDSVADLVDEIILVDTGSTDNTKAVAAEYAAKIYDFPWCDDFSAARNYAVSQAVGDYWLWLDADDVIEGENHEKLRKILEAPEADMVFLPYWLSFDAAGTPQMISRRERIFRRSRGYRFTGAVHEAVVPSGSIRYGDAAVSHRKLHAGDPDRNLHIYQKLLLSGKRFSPREQYYYARELCDHGAYRAALPVLEQFLQEGRGWTPDNIGACLLAGRCYARLEQPDEAMQSLFRSFCYGIPQPEICCEIGGLFLEQQQYPQAAFWYHLAIETGHQPHEGFWRQEGVSGIDFSNKSAFRWTSVIRLPDFITPADFRWAVETASEKKKLDCSSAEFLTVHEGLCVQILHLGPYDDEPASVAAMDRFLTENGFQNDLSDTRLHHEIYLSDPRKTPPEKRKTVIRHPIKAISEA